MIVSVPDDGADVPGDAVEPITSTAMRL